MDRVDLLEDRRFTKLADRAKHGDTINGIVADWTATLDARVVEERCVAHDVPVATAYTSADIFADPHFAARGDLVTVDDPVIGPIRQQAPFPRTVGETPAAPSGAPRLGEHTDDVLSTLLHLSRADIDALRAKGVV
jgi:crotonobetainyl-CoA:carnitine CoA-transferase CaiB-like acyl-CoA transferase